MTVTATVTVSVVVAAETATESATSDRDRFDSVPDPDPDPAPRGDLVRQAPPYGAAVSVALRFRMPGCQVGWALAHRGCLLARSFAGPCPQRRPSDPHPP